MNPVKEPGKFPTAPRRLQCVTGSVTTPGTVLFRVPAKLNVLNFKIQLHYNGVLFCNVNLSDNLYSECAIVIMNKGLLHSYLNLNENEIPYFSLTR